MKDQRKFVIDYVKQNFKIQIHIGQNILYFDRCYDEEHLPNTNFCIK